MGSAASGRRGPIATEIGRPTSRPITMNARHENQVIAIAQATREQSGGPSLEPTQQSIVITGAASGLGLASARLFATQGAALVLVDQNAEAVLKAAADLGGARNSVVSVSADIATVEGARRCIEEALHAFGKVDVLFSNAGIDPPTATTLVDTTESDWDRIMAVNVKGTYLLAREVLPPMLRANGGIIIATASIAGIKALPRESAYCVSKAALIHLIRTLSRDYAKNGIRANCVCPGFLEKSPSDRQTPITSEERATRAQWAAELVPMGRWGTYDEIARTVAFLAGPEATYINGATLLIDGGWAVC